MDAVAESDRNLVSKHDIQPGFLIMNVMTRDRTVKLVARDEILRRERVQGKNIFLVQLTSSRIGKVELPICYYT